MYILLFTFTHWALATEAPSRGFAVCYFVGQSCTKILHLTALNGLGMAQKLRLEMSTQPLENASDVAGVPNSIA